MSDPDEMTPEEFRDLQASLRRNMPPELPPAEVVEFVTKSGRVLTTEDIDGFVAEAEHGYDVSSGEPRLYECCSYRDMFNGACPCPAPRHTGDPMHPLAGVW